MEITTMYCVFHSKEHGSADTSDDCMFVNRTTEPGNVSELDEIKEREIFLQKILRLLRERFPGETLQEDGSLRDLADAAFDVMQEYLTKPN